MFYSCEVNFEKKKIVLPLRNFIFFLYSKKYDNVTTPNYSFFTKLFIKRSLMGIETQKKIREIMICLI